MTMMPSQLRRWIAAASFGFLAVAMAFFPGGNSQAQAPVNICDRTPQVETAILTELGLTDDDACMTVSAAGLGGITTLTLTSTGITDLDVDDFVGLDGLTSLDLSGNDDLTTLPPGVLDPVLDTLETLDLDSRLRGEISFVEENSVAVSNTTATISVVRTQPYTAVTVSVAVSGDRADLFTAFPVTIPAGTTQTTINVGLGLDAINKVVTLTLMPPALVPSNANVVGEVVQEADSPGNTHVLTGSSPTATFRVFTEEFGGTEVSGDLGDLILIAEGSTLFTRFTLSRPLAGSEQMASSLSIMISNQNIMASPAELRINGMERGFNTFTGFDFGQPGQTARLEVMVIDDGIVEGPERFAFSFFGIGFSSNFDSRGLPLHITPPGEVIGSILFTFEIQDNDTATATVVVTGAAQEGGTMPTAAVTLSAPLAADAVFTLALQAGADNPATVNGADADVTFAGGLTTATVTAGDMTSDAVNIHVVNDEIPDNGKRFSVEIIRIEAAVELSRPGQSLRRDLDSLITRIASGDVAISDDDPLRLSTTTATNPGESGDVAVTLTLNGNAPAGETVISYRVVEDASSEDPVESADFGPIEIRTTTDGMTGSSNVVTVQADGSDTLAFSINVADDNRVEFSESGIVSIVRIEYADGSSLTTTTNSTAPFTITDNDLLTVGFPANGRIGVLEDMMLFLSFIVGEAEIAEDVTVTVDYTPISATPGNDYAAVRTDITIPAADYTAETLMLIDLPVVTIRADTLIEGDETFTATLSTSAPGVMLSTPTATITITDNNRLTVEFSTTAYSITEGETRNLMLSVSGGRIDNGLNVAVLIFSENGSATAGNDYSAANGDVAIPIADYTTEAFVNVPVTTLQDNLVEGVETFTVALSQSLQPHVRLGDNTMTTVTITDDDFPSSIATLTASDSDAGEFNNEPGAVTLALMPGTPGASATVNFILSTATGTATLGEAADYTLAITHSSGVVVTLDPFSAAGGSFRLPGGVTEAVFTVTPVADAVADDGETVVIRVTGVDFSAGLDVTVPTTERTVTIADYGTLPTATLAGTDAILGEGETHVSTLTFTDAPSRSTATVFLHADGSDAGVDANDYTLTVAYAGSGNPESIGTGTESDPYSFPLPAGVSEATIRVFLVDDSLAEAQETLRLTLLRVEFSDLGDGTDITFSDQISVTITDNDLLTVGFVNEGIYRIPEDMPTSLTLSVSGADTTDFQDVTVTVRDTPEVMTVISEFQDEAILNEDYAALNSSVIIPAGDYTAETIINVPVTIVDDNLTEFEEVFTAELSTSTNSPGVMLASTTIATILIIDDDQLTVEFSTTAYSITEGDEGNLVLSVSGGNTTYSVTVSVSSSDGSAAAGDDYAVVAFPLFSIPAADYTTEAFINVPVTTLEDDLVEGDETFTVTLGSIHSFTTPGNNTVATVTIIDDDFSSSSAALTTSDPDAGEFNNEPGAVTLALMPGAPGASATVNFILSTAIGTATLVGEAPDYTLAITHSPGVVVTPDPFSAAGGSFQLPGGVTEAVFTVTPVADAVSDDGETVVIRVTGVDFSAGPDITVPTTERTVTIADYGALPAATLAGADATLGEGETHVSTLTFTDAPSRSTATVFLHADGSDAGVDAADYTLTVAYAGSGNPESIGTGTESDPHGFPLPAGVSEATIRVFLVDDSLAEAQETLRLTLLRVEFSDLGDGTDIALSDRISVTITESVARLVAELATAGTPTEENLTTGTFTLQLSDAPTVSTASFNYAFTGGIVGDNFDATWRINDGAATDISNLAGSITVPESAFSGNPGEADVVFTITPRDDRNSVNEQITLTISNLVHGTTAINNIINNPAHLRITDDDDSIRLRIRTFLEGALQ